MKNDAIVCNIGHFDCEIDVKERARFITSLASSLKGTMSNFFNGN